MAMKDAVSQQQMMSEEENLEHMQEEAGDITRKVAMSKEAKLKKRKQEVKIAMNMRTRIELYMDGSVAEDLFVLGFQEEAKKIAKGSFGATFLVTIGTVLQIEADEFL
eukprot:11291502-Ditylum_brightwellii.AAC.1